jgi:hypothetical protein
MTKKLNRYQNKALKYNYLEGELNQSGIRGSYMAANQVMTNLPKKYLRISETNGLIIMSKDSVPNDFNPMAFLGINEQIPKSSFMSALISIRNSDIRYETSSMARLIYPHKYNLPCISESNIYFIKLIVNGMRRCFTVDDIVDQSLFYTKKKEVYPFLLQKAFSKIYPADQLNIVNANFIVYRMIGWIPETLNYTEIGDAQTAFNKLLKNMESFAIIINFEYKGQVLPLLELKYDEKTKKRLFVTINPKQKDPSNIINTEVFGKEFLYRSC